MAVGESERVSPLLPHDKRQRLGDVPTQAISCAEGKRLKKSQSTGQSGIQPADNPRLQSKSGTQPDNLSRSVCGALGGPDLHPWTDCGAFQLPNLVDLWRIVSALFFLCKLHHACNKQGIVLPCLPWGGMSLLLQPRNFNLRVFAAGTSSKVNADNTYLQRR